jgi:hypothetical protein
MRLAALHHTDRAGELAAFQAAVSSATELVLGRSPNNTTRAEVVGELATGFQKVEGHHLKLERHVAGICDLLLRPPLGRAWLVDHLDETTRLLREELTTRWEAEAEF